MIIAYNLNTFLQLKSISRMNGRWKTVEKQLNTRQQINISFTTLDSLSGGCINQAWKATDSSGEYWFIKENSLDLLAMFEAEYLGLEEILQSQTIRVPKPICVGNTDSFSYLVLEYIPLQSSVNHQMTGQQLAAMHQITDDNKQFGWSRNNTIGSTPQLNQQNDNWGNFWKQQRLLPQLSLAQKKGYAHSAYDAGLKLADSLEVFFQHNPSPSLLHGDLWGGNCATDTENNPVIFDPALYYGDRETDIAMTELFGGFNQTFYDAYNNVYPLDSAYKTRKTLYNLYHILNHYNLFGGGYASQAESMTKQLLSEIS